MTQFPGWRPLLAAAALLTALPALADAEAPAFTGEATDIARLDNGLRLLGDEVASPDGMTSGFRLTAGFSPRGLPSFDLGAEVRYRESDDVPVAGDTRDTLLDTTSLGGSLLAGVRLGRLGLYAKSGLAGWQGQAPHAREAGIPEGGTTRINGFGARLSFDRWISRLEFEEVDDPALSHLNLITASVHLPF
ncbi:hypothetical protein [Halomonas koreensis]|uniref:Outer membrane protein beta-barrel domain-containing protein n=1 Tax=Halomonas koreensis TaxID=245385 RepID=A0ABU1G032_9GAMM|nr:hypothetical protein [Halomonas koreensis]MDR5866306.1 hypothetical protein [Halomonas koreensis]